MLAVGAVLAASVALALGAARTGLPALVAFLGLGMVLGSDGPGGIAFDDATVAREVGIVSLVAILYEGGLSTSWRRLRGVAIPATLLSTVGVVVTAGITGGFAHLFFDLSWPESFLLGSVVSSTDAAAVFATLRRTRLRRGLARTLEAESGGNDPVAIALTLGLIAWIERPPLRRRRPWRRWSSSRSASGCSSGSRSACSRPGSFARIPPSIGSFVPVASAATAALAFGAADAAHGSGFLSVYLVGLAVGSTPSRFRGQLVTFHEGVAYVAQVGLFIVLGLLVFPSRLPHVALAGLGLAVALMVVARPVAVWASTLFVGFSARERVLLGWAGLRGAVPIVLATFVLSSRLGSADTIFNAVFFVVLVSVALQGTTLEWLAGRLGLVSAAAPSQPPLAVTRTGMLNLEEFRVAADHAIAGAAVRELGLPREALVAVVVRGDDAIPPRGSTRIEAEDVLFVLVPHGKRPEVEDVFERWRRRV